jgi:AAA+ ATPase superfamily predicted ATPase
MLDIPDFVNREKEKKELKAILSGRPNFVYFVYGPINSGKTALLMKVAEELSEDYRIFYINFRGFEGGYPKFTRAFFELGDEILWKKLRNKAPIISAAVEYVEKVAKKINTAIELPGEVIRMLQVGGDDPEKIDLFHYLERLMSKLVEKGRKPVLILDEMQVLKDEINAVGQPLLARLFNFAVRMTKETHLCHVLCATSDCLFIDTVCSNARLEGRAEYLLVDDLDKEEAFKAYEEFGFEGKEKIWNFIGGKLGDMIRLFEKKKRGCSEEEALNIMLKDETAKFELLLRSFKYSPLKVNIRGNIVEVKSEEFGEGLKIFKEREEVFANELEEPVLLGGIQENILFYNPLEGTVRPQSKLLLKVIRKVLANRG